MLRTENTRDEKKKAWQANHLIMQKRRGVNKIQTRLYVKNLKPN